MGEKELQVTFWSKNLLKCPVCGTEFKKEELRSGGGRLNAGDMGEDLRRYYIPSKKYGEIFPLIYPVIVCPGCLYAAGNSDFFEIAGKDKIISALRDKKNERKEALEKIFSHLDFTENRALEEGAASYYYGMLCLECFPKNFSPTIKQGLYSMRAGWIFSDLHKKHPTENYDYLASIFFRKAKFFYITAIEKEQTGVESLGNLGNSGPDLDKNYGYDGILYLAAFLAYKYGSENKEARIKELENAKKTVARIFGMGKASKDKPSAILENARSLYDKVKDELKNLEGE